MPDPELAAALDTLRRAAGEEIVALGSEPVAGVQRVAAMRRRVAECFELGGGTAPDEVVRRVVDLLREGTLHVNHPRYFGLFNPTVLPGTVVADALVALYNPQLAVWEHSPAACEMERLVLRSLGSCIGFGTEYRANFTSGGQEANASAVLVALTRAFPEFARSGARALSGQPTLYLSEQGHDSFVKIAHASGLGRDAVRRVGVDEQLRLDPEALRARLRGDREQGRLPFLVAATAGTTSAGVIDDLPALAAIAAEEGLWLHVDAAWGGGALLSERLRPTLAGIERADSVTWDAHKWLAVPVAAGMFFCRHPEPAVGAFAVDPVYVADSPAGVDDPYASTMQWSRRFIGLKLLMALAEHGFDGYAAQVEHQTAMGDLLRQRLEAAGWRLCNRTKLPLVCFTHPAISAGDVEAETVVERLRASGVAWMSTVALPGERPCLRACICSYRTQAADIDVTVDGLDRALGEVAATA